MRPVVHVVGGGPGDPELLTVKGARLLGEARFVLYTGRLFPEGALRELAPKAALLDSKGMTLEEIVLALAEEGLLEVADRAVTPAQMEEAYRRYLGKVAGLGLAKAVLEDREGR